MSKNKLSAMSNDELLKQQKTLKTITATLAGAIFGLFVVTLILALKKQLIALHAIPIILVPILEFTAKYLNDKPKFLF